jgi:hypothetical protein
MPTKTAVVGDTFAARIRRRLRDADDSLRAAHKMITSDPEVPLDDQTVRNAATQARQAAQYLDQVTGMLEAEWLRRATAKGKS